MFRNTAWEKVVVIPVHQLPDLPKSKSTEGFYLQRPLELSGLVEQKCGGRRCPLFVQPHIIFKCMIFCGYLDIWTTDGNFGKLVI